MTYKKSCPNCNNFFELTEEHFERNLICPVCEEKFFVSAKDFIEETKETPAVPATIPPPPPKQVAKPVPIKMENNYSKSGFFSDFYHFRIMILPCYIKIICILNMVIAAFAGFALAVSGLFMGAFGILIILLGLIVMIILPIAVRFAAEYLSVQFTINSTLQRIEKLLEER